MVEREEIRDELGSAVPVRCRGGVFGSGTDLRCVGGAWPTPATSSPPRTPNIRRSTAAGRPAPVTGDAPDPCSVATPNQFFEQTAGHPQVGFTQFIVKNEARPGRPETPVGELKTVRVDLPVGLSVNPQATPQCATRRIRNRRTARRDTQKSGTAKSPRPLRRRPFPRRWQAADEVPVYNLGPGRRRAGPLRLRTRRQRRLPRRATSPGTATSTRASRSHVPAALPEALAGVLGLLTGESGLILKNRLVFDGRSGNGTFITTPSTCFGPAGPVARPSVPPLLDLAARRLLRRTQPDLPRRLLLLRVADPARNGPRKNCGSIPFDPSVGVDPEHRPDRLAERARRSPSTCRSNRRRPESLSPA